MQKPLIASLTSIGIGIAALPHAHAQTSGAEISGACCAHANFASQKDIGQYPKLLKKLLHLPSDLPSTFSVQVPLLGQQVTLQLEKSKAFGKHTSVLIDDGTGTLIPIDPGPDRSYTGIIVERPDIAVSAVLSKKGLVANIMRPGQESIEIKPVADAEDPTLHEITLGESGDYTAPKDQADANASASAFYIETDEDQVAASIGPVITAFTSAMFSSALAPEEFESTATLPPSTIMNVLEFEVGVEIGSRAFFGETSYNGSLDAAMASVQTIPGNLDMRFLKSAGVKHRLGTIIIRTNSSTDPLRNSITNSGAGDNARAGLEAFRDYWNDNPEEVGTTHDLAVYHVFSPPSGLAFIRSIGGDNRYATSAGQGPTSWANGTLAHEFGHSWDLRHVPDTDLFYESLPRNSSGVNTAGGPDIFTSIMPGSGGHNVGRLATDEAEVVMRIRQASQRFGDLIPPEELENIRPYPRRDEVRTVVGEPVVIDAIANDIDVNNDVLDAQLLDTVSHQGGTISLSRGTGPGGRNEIIYTPPPGHNGRDFFHYSACEVNSGNLRNWGAIHITNFGPIDTTLTNYHYDFGSLNSVLQPGLAIVSPENVGVISWSDVRLTGVDRGRGEWSDADRDFIVANEPAILRHQIAPGPWRVSLSMGDPRRPSDEMRVQAEDGQVVREGITSEAAEFSYVEFDVDVSDGFLDLEFSDQGGSSNRWIVNRLRIARPPVITESVTITNSGSAASTSRGTEFTLSDFDPNSGNKLVVTASAEGNGGRRTVSGITFRGAPLSQAIASNAGRASSIWYLDNPGTAPGEIIVTWNGQVNGCGIGAYSLLGAEPEAPAVTQLADTITTTDDGSVVIASFVANGGSNPTIDAPYTLGYGADIGSAVGAAASVELENAGTTTATFTTTGAIPTTLLAAFRPIRTRLPFAEVEGTVSIEAENYFRVEARNSTFTSWIFGSSNSGFTGSGYMHVPNGSSISRNLYNHSARMLYDVDFSTTGNYRIYVRRRATSGESNSVFAGIDGIQSSEVDNRSMSNNWIWADLGAVNIASPGVFPIDLVVREDGYQVDKIVATTGTAPTGNGPAESARIIIREDDGDDDGDGLPNSFELEHYGHITDNADETSDLDSDGSTDGSELIAGTNPDDRNSLFRITDVSLSGNEITIVWDSVAGKTYTILQSDNLTSWNPVSNNISSDGSSTSRVIPLSNDHRFFSVSVSEE